MSDAELISYLRNSKGWPTLGNAAADRIEVLGSKLAECEAQLGKAVELLRKHCDTWAMNDFDTATLAEIKGE